MSRWFIPTSTTKVAPQEPIPTPVRKRLFPDNADLPENTSTLEPSPKKLCHGDQKDGSDRTHQPETTETPVGGEPDTKDAEATAPGEEEQMEQPEEQKPAGLTDRQASLHIVSNSCYEATLYLFMCLMFLLFALLVTKHSCSKVYIWRPTSKSHYYIQMCLSLDPAVQASKSG